MSGPFKIGICTARLVNVVSQGMQTTRAQQQRLKQQLRCQPQQQQQNLKMSPGVNFTNNFMLRQLHNARPYLLMAKQFGTANIFC